MEQNQAFGRESGVVGVVVRDLMFQSRITKACKDLGLPYEVIRVLDAPPGPGIGRLIVDLGQDGVIEWVAGLRNLRQVPVIGFVSHTDVQTIARARSAGVSRVLSRGAFVRQLDAVLRGDLPQVSDEDGRD